MIRRKKVYDNETGEVQEVEQGQEPTFISEFVESFCDTFRPCERESEADEVFTMGSLRRYFQAYTTPGTPDALPQYLTVLGQRGFTVHTSYTGEPSLFVRWNGFPIED